MRATEIKTKKDAMKYIGNSTSWKKAYYASMRKWDLIKSGRKGYLKEDSCGFCFVASIKIGQDVRNLDSYKCQLCPVFRICGYDIDETVIEELKALKPKIWKLK